MSKFISEGAWHVEKQTGSHKKIKMVESLPSVTSPLNITGTSKFPRLGIIKTANYTINGSVHSAQTFFQFFNMMNILPAQGT